jgi:hypothetical protein
MLWATVTRSIFVSRVLKAGSHWLFQQEMELPDFNLQNANQKPNFGGYMRFYLSLAIVAPLLVAMGENAHARTCAEIAQVCVNMGGARETCFESARMASCKSTGTYVSPRGNSFPATDATKKK